MPAPTPAPSFPLSVAASGRYLVDANGAPLLLHGDTPWSIVVQLTNAQIDTYLNDRAARGFTAIMFNAIEHKFTSQNPRYNNVDGVAPFLSMTNFASGLSSAYWSRVDYIVDRAKALGMVCVINPAYWGYNGGDEGWYAEVQASSSAALQSYGAALAARYTQGNVIWCLGGDYNGADTAARNKQWNIVTGIRSVRTTDIFMGHPAPGTEGFEVWSGFPGWNLNTTYCYEDGGTYVYGVNTPAFARPGPIPLVFLEGRYEGEPNPPVDLAQIRRQSYGALLSGACGQFFGNNPIWHFQSPATIYTYTGTWQTNLASTGSRQQSHVNALFAALEWWKLAPRFDTSLVTSSLGSGAARLYPARASDGSFAAVWKNNSASLTVLMSALTNTSVRARWYDPTNGTYSTVSGSPFSNTGSRVFAHPGSNSQGAVDWILILD